MSRVALVCAASKGLGRASAEALARDGVRVAICSRGGPALADAAASITSAGGEVLAIEADSGGRMGTAEVFAAVVSFLASPAASFVTGVTLPVDGGWTRGL